MTLTDLLPLQLIRGKQEYKLMLGLFGFYDINKYTCVVQPQKEYNTYYKEKNTEYSVRKDKSVAYLLLFLLMLQQLIHFPFEQTHSLKDIKPGVSRIYDKICLKNY